MVKVFIVKLQDSIKTQGQRNNNHSVLKQNQMNFLSNLSTKKNSVNSSLATIKPPKDMNETISRYREKCQIRFSHQQQQKQQPKRLQRNSSHKESLKFEQCFDESILGCMNHESKPATHMILSGSESPMYYCERCAILIASKGFNVEPIEGEKDKENKNKMNSRRGSFSQYENKSNPNRKECSSTQQNNKTQSPKANQKPQQPSKVQLSNDTISELEHCWKSLKSGRQSNLNQIDMYINTLNENIDFLEDYFYVLHEYVQKQKNTQLKEIISKKQLLEQLRSEVSGVFVNSFMSLKELKEKLVRFGQCSFELYQQTLHQATFQKFSLNFQAAIEELAATNNHKQLTLHSIGLQITSLIKNFNLISSKNQSQPHQKRPSMHKSDPRPLNHQPTHKPINNLKDQRAKNFQNPDPYIPNNYELPHIPGINHAESSVRSLQLSFDNSENESQTSPRKEREETNNFTLNQYINQRGEESYTNLLMTSTDMS